MGAKAEGTTTVDKPDKINILEKEVKEENAKPDRT